MTRRHGLGPRGRTAQAHACFGEGLTCDDCHVAKVTRTQLHGRTSATGEQSQSWRPRIAIPVHSSRLVATASHPAEEHSPGPVEEVPVVGVVSVGGVGRSGRIGVPGWSIRRHVDGANRRRCPRQLGGHAVCWESAPGGGSENAAAEVRVVDGLMAQERSGARPQAFWTRCVSDNAHFASPLPFPNSPIRWMQASVLTLFGPAI